VNLGGSQTVNPPNAQIPSFNSPSSYPSPYAAEAVQPYASTVPLSGGPGRIDPQPAYGPPAPEAPLSGTATVPQTAVPRFAEYDQALLGIQPLLQTGRLADALTQLTQWYGDPRLSPEQSAELAKLLDPLSATVVYSYEYPLDAYYVVQPGDTLDQVAARYSVEWQTLAKINGLADPRQLQSGQQLKVVRGPFHAVVDLSDHELTLIVDGRYAGRFLLGVGQDFPQQNGQYTVREKSLSGPTPVYQPRPGYVSSAPVRSRWIGLAAPLGIHASADPAQIGQTAGPGFLCLCVSDLAEVYDLLSVGSTVTVRP
jgi:LysM repeat protein